jgi:hypothetical protein
MPFRMLSPTHNHHDLASSERLFCFIFECICSSGEEKAYRWISRFSLPPPELDEKIERALENNYF